MTVSTKGEYALEAIFDLALHAGREPVKIADIARRRQIPQKFLELILSGLKQGGFVESRRGAEGGYLLARPAERITVGEVLRFVESSRTPRTRPGRDGNTQPFADVWARVDEAVSGVLDQTTFAEVVRNWNERRKNYVPDWDI